MMTCPTCKRSWQDIMPEKYEKCPFCSSFFHIADSEREAIKKFEKKHQRKHKKLYRNDRDPCIVVSVRPCDGGGIGPGSVFVECSICRECVDVTSMEDW